MKSLYITIQDENNILFEFLGPEGLDKDQTEMLIASFVQMGIFRKISETESWFYPAHSIKKIRVVDNLIQLAKP